ncbi:aminotransferase class IV [Pontibacter sp. SGAir0037]|uniref:aminotransferase class IV n=1 Tax=Pontibacter sp. SGAir0037 TaxID=2571030 RepID=UPI0010CD6401|nr:aminotransferase class IV [Pontibacter sp. SGAir0037]QCR21347.1 amino acid aminotransferase [Pontibacter sp. SGAir0037]
MPSDKPLFASVNQVILPYENASLHISDLAIQRGYGVFDFFKCQGQRPLFLPEYLDRLYDSARFVELAVPLSRDELETGIYKLLEKNDLELSGMKIIVTGGYSANGYDPVKPNLVMLQQPLVLPDAYIIEQGIKVITHEYVRELPLAKTINYVTGIKLIRQIREQGAADVLYHQNGIVTELPRCNFFIVRQDNTVVTPAQDVLAGITRKNVLQLAARKFKAEAATVTLDDVANAKEAFLTSTTKRILPIVQVDNTIIGKGKPGEVTLSLLKELVKVEHG